MSKPLDKHTKGELIQFIVRLQAEVHALRADYETCNFDRNALKDQLAALEARRRFEAQSYRAQLRQRRAPASPARIDWAAAAKDYCAQFGVRSVSREELQRFVETSREPS